MHGLEHPPAGGTTWGDGGAFRQQSYMEEECPLTSSFLSASCWQFGCDLSDACSFHMLPCHGGLYPSETINQNKLLDLQVAFDCGMLSQQERSD